MQGTDLRYMSGFGGHFESEAVEGALPKGRNSPQRPAFGLYAEQLSGSAFTVPRHENLRSWLYRLRPTADHRPFVRYEGARLFAPGTVKEPLAPNRLRWNPPGDLPSGADFVDGMVTMLANRDPSDLEGVAVHLYRAQRSMENRVFIDAGFDWREPGCSMCLAMNPDKVPPRERCASTSNRNFVGRQGPGARTHLMSPAMAAAAAVTGRLTDVRELLSGDFGELAA